MALNFARTKFRWFQVLGDRLQSLIPAKWWILIIRENLFPAIVSFLLYQGFLLEPSAEFNSRENSFLSLSKKFNSRKN